MNVLDTHLLKVQYADDLGTLSFKFRIITTCSNRGIKLPVSCIRCITLNDFSQLYKQMGDGIRTTRIFYVTYTPPQLRQIPIVDPPFPCTVFTKYVNICCRLLYPWDPRNADWKVSIWKIPNSKEPQKPEQSF